MPMDNTTRISFGSILGIQLALILLATLFVALRFFVKIKFVRNVGCEDYVVLLSLASLRSYNRLSIPTANN